MNPAEPQLFAAQWADAWNRRDVEGVLQHFHDDVTFTSPTALAVVGTPVVHGKAALRDYWNRALAQVSTLQFTVDRVVWDAARRELAIIYVQEINGQSKRISENLRLDESGLVIRAEVFHGVAG